MDYPHPHSAASECVLLQPNSRGGRRGGEGEERGEAVKILWRIFGKKEKDHVCKTITFCTLTIHSVFALA